MNNNSQTSSVQIHFSLLQGTTTSFLEEDSVPMERYMKVETALATANVSVMMMIPVDSNRLQMFQVGGARFWGLFFQTKSE